MFNLFSSRKIGIDIGTGQIKIVELAKNKKGFDLKNYAIWTISSDGDDVIQTSSLNMLEEDIAGRIKDLVREAKIKTKKTVMSLSSFSAFSTVIEMPEMPQNELSQAIEFEAKHYIPIPLSEVHLDWAVVGERKIEKIDNIKKNSQFRKQEVLLVALPNDLLKKYEDIAQRTEVKLSALELETFALVRSLLGNSPEPTLVIDLGKRSTSLNIMERGIVFLSKNLDTGGNEISRSISRALNVSFERAEAVKKTLGLNADSNIKNVINTTLDIIVNEVERLLEIYTNKHKKKIEGVILTGGVANLIGLKDYFQKKINIGVEVGNPWKNVNYPKILEPTLTELSPTLTVAIGLAMRED